MENPELNEKINRLKASLAFYSEAVQSLEEATKDFKLIVEKISNITNIIQKRIDTIKPKEKVKNIFLN